MDLRLRNLEQLDSRAVPLPHGTEVVTRVDRIVGERRVPQGSVGRVTRIDGDNMDVTIIGVGVVQYARGELSPRRVRQVLFAHRRADAWDALRPCVVLDTTVGSRAWACWLLRRSAGKKCSSGRIKRPIEFSDRTGWSRC